nr:uncharacterized protein LOC129268387 [Lytechinus pictus]
MSASPSPSACKHLARSICCLPCLTNLTITGIEELHDDFFIDFASMAASSTSPYFMERKHIPLLDENLPGWRKLQLPVESSSSAASTNHFEVEPSQHQGPPTGQTNLPPHQQEVTTLNDPLTGFQSEPMDLSINYPQQIPGETIQSSSGQEQVTNSYTCVSDHRTFSHGYSTEHLSVPGSQESGQYFDLTARTSAAVFHEQEEPASLLSTSAFIAPASTHPPFTDSDYNDSKYQGWSIGLPICEEDDDPCLPSTSGITSQPRGRHADIDPTMSEHVPETFESSDDTGDDEETTEESVEWDRFPPHSHSKRIHSESSDDTGDDEEATEESVDLADARPRKRRAKTDRNTTSP